MSIRAVGLVAQRGSMGVALAGLAATFVLAASAASAAHTSPPPGRDVTAAPNSNRPAPLTRLWRQGRPPRLRAVDGGPRYYRRFSNALPSNPSYFPIGVWLECVPGRSAVQRDKDAGLNLYVALCGPSQADYNRVKAHGMRALLQQDEWNGRGVTFNSAMAGWLLHDEIDMQMSPEAGYAELQRIKSTLPADRRLRYNNFGKGVLFWAKNVQAARYVNAVDVPSTDVYWFSDNNVCDFSEGGRLLTGGRRALTDSECHRASNYGAQVQRVRSLVAPRGSKPVWNFVEVGHPASEDHWPGITPPQIRAAVWHSLIAGARGIIYFNHSFGGPCETQHALREPCYSSARAAVKGTNKQIKALARVLNAPFVTSGWSHNPATKAMVKWQGGHFYVFAGSAENVAATGSFSIPCVGRAAARAVGEKRAIPIRGGSFSDSFADGNAVHIYRIDGGSACGLKRRP